MTRRVRFACGLYQGVAVQVPVAPDEAGAGAAAVALAGVVDDVE